MEYIYRFIEYINESNLISVGTLLFIIMYLIMLYNKKEKDERFLGLKLFGFYILGGFNFNLKMNWFILALPLGFCIYYFFMKGKERPNPTIKHKAAILGMIMMYVGVVNTMAYEKAEYRERTIKVENANFETLGEDYALIEKKLGIDYASFEGIQLDYDSDGKITYLNYSVRDDSKLYNVFYDKDSYKVNVSPAHNGDFSYLYGDNRGQFEARVFFDMLKSIDFKKYENATSYRMVYGMSDQTYENTPLYLINSDNYSVKELENVWSVNDANGIEYSAFLNPTEEDKEGYAKGVYLFYHGNTEYNRNYDEVVIESIKNNNSVVIKNQEDLKEIYRETKEEQYGWAPINDLEINFEPDLYIKFSDESTIGLCEKESFIRVDEDGVSVWYLVPSDLYTFVINKYFDATK